MSPRSVAILVPTTGAVMELRSLTPRPGLPHSAAFAEGDYRPLTLSADYRALTGPEGPLARHKGGQMEPHEMRLSAAPETGRSWEAPVALAHMLLAQGWVLKPTPEEADLTLWATGAVDLDLGLIPADYSQARKAELSLQVLQGTRDSLAILPPGPGRDEARALFETAGVRCLSTDTLSAVEKALAEPQPASTPKRGLNPAYAVTGGLGILATVALVFMGKALFSEPETIPVVPEAPPSTDVAPAAEPPAPTAPPLYAIFPTEGSSCRQALFNPDLRRLAAVSAQGTGYALLSPVGLCGLSTTGPAPQTSPPDALISAQSPPGRQDFFLRGGVQNLVYTVPDGSDGRSGTIRPAIETD